MGLEKELLFLMNQSEKRLFKRLEVDLEVEILIDGSPVKVTTANISCGGLFLKLDPDHLKDQDDFSVIIYLPNRKNPVEVAARVLRKESDSRAGVALEFDSLYTDNILAIEQFIKSNLH